MMHKFYLNVLPKNQLSLWKKFESQKFLFENLDYYMAGGTALALQMGHRESMDFDFFSERPNVAEKTSEWLKEAFSRFTVREKDAHTLHAELQGVKLSFIGNYQYSLLQKPVQAENTRLASILDIGLMKLLAITHRATLRDYLDLAVIVRDAFPLQKLLEASRKKYGKRFNLMIPLKALVAFDDIEMDSPTILDKNLSRHWKKILLNAVKEVAIH